MAEIQDEDQWLYGDDKGDTPKPTSESPPKENGETVEKDAPETVETPKDPDLNTSESAVTEKPVEEPKPAEVVEEEKENKDDSDSSSDDEPTVTIGKIVKQPDIIRPPPPPTHRAAPTSGLKDDDFTSVGKINGVPAYDYNLMELEEKPWRKPGADLSDYFNYGFTEETWFKYCERQKAIRTNESGVGLGGLGVNMSKSAQSFAFGSSNIPVSIVNDNSKYGSRKFNFPPPSHDGTGQNDHNSINDRSNDDSQINTIQVMTADRRMYSQKHMLQSGYDDMDFGGYGNSNNSNYYNTPPPQSAPPPFFSHPPPIHTPSWPPSVPPPGYGGPPPPMPVPPPVNYFIKDIKEEPIDPDLPPLEKTPTEKRARSKERDSIRRRSREPRDKESRYRESSRRRTRSPSKTRTRSPSKARHRKKRSPSRAKSRSKSHSPSWKHKKKKSKKERSERERSKERSERERSKEKVESSK